MLGRHPPSNIRPLALSIVENGPSDSAPRRRSWRRGGSNPALPAREGRTWIHPSELPNFDDVPTYEGGEARRHLTPLVLASAAAILALGSVTLALRTTTPPTTQSLPSNIAHRVSDLPLFVQRAARSAVELVITDNGHISATAAMVIAPGNLAVTTTPISPDASIIGSSQLDQRFVVTRVTRDRALGFTVVHLGRFQPVTPTAILPSAATVTAISPYFTPTASTPEIAWATTTLGDPVRESADGVVSYLATTPAPNLHGFLDSLAVDDGGQVVAVLSRHNQWYSAQYLTKVAQALAQNGGCHVRLGIAGGNSPDGGVLISAVDRGSSWQLLRTGDVLQMINGSRLDSMDSLLAYLYAATSNHMATIQLARRGQMLTVDVLLRCRP